MKMNSKLIVLILIVNFFSAYHCLEISCWSIFESNSYRQEVLLNNINRLKDPRCVVITRSYLLFFRLNSFAFCPGYVKNSDKNRKLLDLYGSDKIVYYLNDKNNEWLNNNYCKTITISSNFDLDYTKICESTGKTNRTNKRTLKYCKRLEISDANFYFSKYDSNKECNLFVSKVDSKNGLSSFSKIKIGQPSKEINKLKIINLKNSSSVVDLYKDEYFVNFYQNILQLLDDLDRLEVFETFITEFIIDHNIDLYRKFFYLKQLFTLLKENKVQFKKDNNYKLHDLIVNIMNLVIEILNEKLDMNSFKFVLNNFDLNENDLEYLNRTFNSLTDIDFIEETNLPESVDISSYDTFNLPESNHIYSKTLVYIAIIIIYLVIVILIIIKIKTNQIKKMKQFNNLKKSKELNNLLTKA